MPNRDDRGQLLKFWGCRGCHTLNTPSEIACQHCAAPRERANSPRRVLLGAAAVAAVAVIATLGVMNWPAAQAAAKVAAASETPTSTPIAPVTIPVVTAPTPPPPPAAVDGMIAALQSDPARSAVSDPVATIAVNEVVRSAPPLTDVPPSTQLISVKWVNVRTAPTPGADILGVIKPQTTVVVLASQDGWVRVKSDALTGWVYGQGVSEKD
jgi:uncharacterized protein YgiM (DUF1202 family)